MKTAVTMPVHGQSWSTTFINTEALVETADVSSMYRIEKTWVVLHIQIFNISFTHNGSCHFLDQSFAETKDWNQTAQLWSQSRVQINQSRVAHITAHSIMSSLMSLYFFVDLRISEKNKVIFIHQNLISNQLTYLENAKSTDELISFGFSDRSVQSSVSAKCSANRWDQKKWFHFWLIFGLSPNLGLSKSLSKRLIQKVKYDTIVGI